jgi:hypothetical protein
MLLHERIKVGQQFLFKGNGKALEHLVTPFFI